MTYNDKDDDAAATNDNNWATGTILAIGWDTQVKTLSLKVNLSAPGEAIITWEETRNKWTLETFSEISPYGPSPCRFHLFQ